MKYILLLSGFVAILSCNREPTLPETPEAVIRQYQVYYDKNEFDKAKILSTIREQQRLDDLKQVLESEPLDSTIFNTNFLSINCQTQQDTSICTCEMKDLNEGEQYTTEYKVVRVKGQWLIEAPEEEVEIEEDFMELDSLELDAFIKKDTLK